MTNKYDRYELIRTCINLQRQRGVTFSKQRRRVQLSKDFDRTERVRSEVKQLCKNLSQSWLPTTSTRLSSFSRRKTRHLNVIRSTLFCLQGREYLIYQVLVPLSVQNVSINLHSVQGWDRGGGRKREQDHSLLPLNRISPFKSVSETPYVSIPPSFSYFGPLSPPLSYRSTISTFSAPSPRFPILPGLVRSLHRPQVTSW